MSLECFVLNCNLQFEYGILWWPGPITNWKRSIDFEKVPRHFEETLSLSRFQSVWLWKKTLQEEVVHHLKRSSTLWCPLKGAALWRTRPAHSLTLLFWFITFKLMATCFYVPLQSADVYVLVSIFFLLSSPSFQNESDVHGNILFLANFVLDSLGHWCILTRI